MNNTNHISNMEASLKTLRFLGLKLEQEMNHQDIEPTFYEPAGKVIFKFDFSAETKDNDFDEAEDFVGAIVRNLCRSR